MEPAGIRSEGDGLDPIEVCTLPPEALGDRLAWIRREILPHALATERLPHGLAIELSAETGLAQKVDQLVRLERDCCSDLAFERLPSAVPGRLRLEIRGIDPDASLFGPLPPAGGAPVGRTRLLTAAGVGVLLSLFVCCVLPLAAGAALGAAAAAPLASLDAPAPILAGALVGAGVAWWWLGRRA